MTPGLVEG